MDVLHDPSSMDLLTPVGFVSALYHATCLKPGSGFLAAPVCSSFVGKNGLKPVLQIVNSHNINNTYLDAVQTS